MNDIVRALGRALVSQLHPRMLWLAVWPFLVSLVLWGVTGYLFSDVAIDWIRRVLGDSFVGGSLDAGFSWVGYDGGLALVATVVYLGSVFTVMVLTALLIIATVAMPTVVGHVATRDYPTLAEKRGGTWFGSLGNALWVSVVFLVGFVLTIPLWLIAPLALLVPLLWWGWATARMFRYDALVVHASAEERTLLFARHGKSFLAIGTVVSLLNFVPPLFFLVPILGGLAFTHFGLQALEKLLATRFGATDIVAARGDEAVAKVRELTGGIGADSVCECVGMTQSWETALDSVRPGGTVGYVGVPAGVTDGLPLGKMFGDNITVAGGVAPTRVYLPELMADVLDGTIDPGPVFTSTVSLDDIATGYHDMDQRRSIKVLVAP